MLCLLQWNVSQRSVLSIAVFIAAISPFLSHKLEVPSSLLFPAVICITVWLQEAVVIQKKYRRENIEFTRRFFDRYPRTGITFFVGFVPHFISLGIVICILMTIDGQPNNTGWLTLIIIFFTLVRILDPLLGCINTDRSIPWSEMLVYVTVFLFATSSAIEPSRFDYYPLSTVVTESIFLVLLTFTILTLRMAFYEEYCFENKLGFGFQFKLVLIPLLILSVSQVMGLIQSLNLSTILGG
jgi:hypothetical protein